MGRRYRGRNTHTSQRDRGRVTHKDHTEIERKRKRERQISDSTVIGCFPGMLPTQDRPGFKPWYPIWSFEPVRVDF